MYRLIQIYADDNDINCLLIDYKNFQRVTLKIKDTLQLMQHGLVSNFIIDGGSIRCQDSQSKSIYVEYHYNDKTTRDKLLKILTHGIKVNIGGKLYKLPEFSDDKMSRNPQKIVHILARIKDKNIFVCCNSCGEIFTSSKEDIIKGVLESKGLSDPIKLVNVKIANGNIQTIRGQLFEVQIQEAKDSNKQPKNRDIHWKYLLKYNKFCDIPSKRIQGYKAWNSRQSADQFRGTEIEKRFNAYYKGTEYEILMHGNNKANMLGYMVQYANDQFRENEGLGYLAKYNLEDYVYPHIVKVVGSNINKVLHRISMEYSVLRKQEAWIKHYPRIFKYYDDHRGSEFSHNVNEELCIAAAQDFIAYRLKNDSKIREELRDVKDDINTVIGQSNCRHLIVLALYIDYLTSKSVDIADSTVFVGQAIALKANFIQDQFIGSEIERLAAKIQNDIKGITGFITVENLKLFRDYRNVKCQDEQTRKMLLSMYGMLKYYPYDTQVYNISHRRLMNTSIADKTFTNSPLLAYNEIKKQQQKLTIPLVYNYTDKSGVEWRTVINADGSELQIQQSDDNFDVRHSLYYNSNSSFETSLYKFRGNLYVLPDKIYNSLNNGIKYEFRALITCRRKTSNGDIITDIIYVPFRFSDVLQICDGYNQKLNNNCIKCDIRVKCYTVDKKVYYAVREGDICYILVPHTVNFNSFEDSRYDLEKQRYSDMNLDRPLLFDYFHESGIYYYKNRINALTVYRTDLSIKFNIDKTLGDSDINFFSEVEIDSNAIARHVIKTW